MGGHFFETTAPPNECRIEGGALKPGFKELQGEDEPGINNLVRRVGDTISFSYQFFPCSPENTNPILGPDSTTIELGDFCYDLLGLNMQKGFYENVLNDIEPIPSPATGCLPADTTSLVCNPKELTFVDVSGDATRNMFLQIARLNSDRSDNTDA